MSKAKNHYRRWLARERIKHEERIKWLSSENPKWSCGTAVASYDRESLLTHSRKLIPAIDEYLNPLRDPRNIK